MYYNLINKETQEVIIKEKYFNDFLKKLRIWAKTLNDSWIDDLNVRALRGHHFDCGFHCHKGAIRKIMEKGYEFIKTMN